VRIATALNQDLETYIGTLESCVWLAGVERCMSTTNALIRKLVTANSRIKAVILAGSIKSEDIIAALEAGACGFLCHNIPGETLLRSLELIAHGQMIVHPQGVWHHSMAEEEPSSREIDDTADDRLAHHIQSRPLGCVDRKMELDNQNSAVPSLSRREMLILRMLVRGASNKVIARTLVITESTVKVHMKAILRKLRLQNRTQAAIWARNNVSEENSNQLVAGSTH